MWIIRLKETLHLAAISQPLNCVNLYIKRERCNNKQHSRLYGNSQQKSATFERIMQNSQIAYNNYKRCLNKRQISSFLVSGNASICV